jgi:hypothetical protein
MGDRLYQDMVKAAKEPEVYRAPTSPARAANPPYSPVAMRDPDMLRREMMREMSPQQRVIQQLEKRMPEVFVRPHGPESQAELAIERAIAGRPLTRMEATKGLYEARELMKMPKPPIIRKAVAEGVESGARAAKHSPLGLAMGIPLAAAVSVSVPVGLAAAAWGGRKLYNAMTYKKDYESMLQHAPEIRNFDKKEVKARFDTLRNFNPKMSRDPLVASSWIKQTIEFPVVTPSTLKDVVQTADQEARLVDYAKMSPKLTPTDIAGGFPPPVE